MDPVTPIIPGMNLPVLVIAKDQPEYRPLPAFVDGSSVLTRWKLSLRERLRVLWRGDIYLTVLTFGRPLQPVRIETMPPTIIFEDRNGDGA